MSLKNLAGRTVKLGLLAFVYVTTVTWLCNVLSKIFKPVTDYVKDSLSHLFPESEATMEKKQKLTQDYFRLVGQQCLACGMYVPRTYVLTAGKGNSMVVKEMACQCCGEPFLENFPEELQEGFTEEQKQKLELIKKKRGIL
jgi:hypothetical protein